MVLKRISPNVAQKTLRVLLWAAALVLVFRLYTWGISQNPRGFCLDESGTAYNAYLVSRTGARGSGARFLLFFAVIRGFLDVRSVFATWRAGKADFWPAEDRHNRCRECAIYALAFREWAIGM